MERIGTLVVAPSTERKAEPGRFGAALHNAAAHVASGIASSVALAAPYVPGGAVLAGAVRAAAPAPARVGTGGGGALTGGSAGITAGSAAGAGAAGGGDVVEATRALQQEAQTFNLQYLQLQESMQRESREFTAVTNVMKVKHDSAKSAINNIH
ncbi:MAG: hypothetical protein ACJ79L_21335 [Anaeromyxobacteraceae bacterium]